MSHATTTRQVAELTSGQLPKFTTLGMLVVAIAVAGGILAVFGAAGPVSIPILGVAVFLISMYALSYTVEGRRRAADRTAQIVVTGFFLIALIPLVSLVWQTVSQGMHRFDAEYFSSSMRNILGEGGGGVHAIWGTVIVTGTATLISVPVGLLTAVYLVEYGSKSKLGHGIRFLVDVMTGIPSIVAGLFAYTIISLLLGPGTKMGLAGSIALTILMIPTVVRSVEEMLRLVPNELREASYALAVPKWRTILKVVIPTSIGGIITGIVLAIARILGETAPLLVTAGITSSMNLNPVDGPMATLPVMVYYEYTQPGIPADPYQARAWTGALVLILIVMGLNLLGRLIAWRLAPTPGR
ncbi:MAG: phosphate ABC transporter permease PstA [Arachnia sp.]